MRLEVFRRHPISNPVPPHQASKTHCSSSTSLNYLNGDEAISANSSNNDKMNELSSDSYDMTTEIRDTQHFDTVSPALYSSYLSFHSQPSLDIESFAATTLLLTLQLQRQSRPKQTRRVFISFFRLLGNRSPYESLMKLAVVDPGRIRAAARVLRAWGLFEASQESSGAKMKLLREVVMFDPMLHPVLKWQAIESRREIEGRRKDDNKFV
ncbi:hypothetical protein TrST_g13249 [Triparma strigata]|uniref:Uncharacterized protein n=1 Tax=Triparma strigata TaxID=1606541 RepID=A0A9W7AGH3_9STRA|nr:hypothetical protein TrST_g13249 [Triparma strigata]